MAKQVRNQLALAYSLLRKDARSCALFVVLLLSITSTVAGNAGETEGTRPAQSVAIKQPTDYALELHRSLDNPSGITGESANGGASPNSLQPSTEPFAMRKWRTSVALAPCHESERFGYGTSGSGFIRYWRPVYKSEDTIHLSEAFDRARDFLLDQLCQ
jgi:hypothetical protein